MSSDLMRVKSLSELPAGGCVRGNVLDQPGVIPLRSDESLMHVLPFSFLRRVPVGIFILACSVLLTAPAHAQTAATITGTVSDPSGSVLPATQLTLRQTTTGLTRTTTSGDDGRFVFAGVQAGEYELQAELAG